MKDKYIIINKSAIQKRIEELLKLQKIHSESGNFPNDFMYKMTITEKNTLQYVLSQSTPLIPEIEKVYEAGKLDKELSLTFDNPKARYLNSLKLDI